MKMVFFSIGISASILLSGCGQTEPQTTSDKGDPFAKRSITAVVQSVVKTEEKGRAIEARASASAMKAVGLGILYAADSKSSSELIAGNAVSTGNVKYCSMSFVTHDGDQFFTPAYSLNWRGVYDNGDYTRPHPLYGICMAIDLNKPPKVQITADKKMWRIGGTEGDF